MLQINAVLIRKNALFIQGQHLIIFLLVPAAFI
jgi:hypothetical protein